MGKPLIDLTGQKFGRLVREDARKLLGVNNKRMNRIVAEQAITA